MVLHSRLHKRAAYQEPTGRSGDSTSIPAISPPTGLPSVQLSIARAPIPCWERQSTAGWKVAGYTVLRERAKGKESRSEFVAPGEGEGERDGDSYSLLPRRDSRGIPYCNLSDRGLHSSASSTAGRVSKSPTELVGSHQRYTILIVDDNEDNLLFAQYAVETFGYKALPVGSGKGALSAALNCQPDAILLDILLQDISGLDLILKLRQYEHLQAVPIIAVTALAMPHNIREIAEAGFSDCLVKPYMLNDLADAIARHLPDTASDCESVSELSA